jgi:hypothetical protein
MVASNLRFKTFEITATSPAEATTAAAATTVTGLDEFETFTVDAAITGGTGGTLDVYVQRKVGTKWLDWIEFPQAADGATIAHYSVDSAAAQSSPTAVGVDAVPALAADTMTVQHPGREVRVVFVAGADTTAGASQTVWITGWRSR